MPGTTARGPWQVGLAACGLIVVGALFLQSALMRINSMSALNVQQSLDEFQNASQFAGMDAAALTEWHALASEVFTLVGTVLVLLGILLWTGWMRPGVRITSTITTAVIAIGGLIPLITSFSSDNALTEASLVVGYAIHVAVFIAVLLLWTKAPSAWVKQEAAAG